MVNLLTANAHEPLITGGSFKPACKHTLDQMKGIDVGQRVVQNILSTHQMRLRLIPAITQFIAYAYFTYSILLGGEGTQTL